VKPTSAGYATYSIEPNLGGLQWMEGAVPTPAGNIQLYCSTKEVRVTGAAGTGTLRFKSKSKPFCKQGNILSKGNNVYELVIEKGKQYVVNYSL
jgi:hypothetical protein